MLSTSCSSRRALLSLFASNTKLTTSKSLALCTKRLRADGVFNLARSFCTNGGVIKSFAGVRKSGEFLISKGNGGASHPLRPFRHLWGAAAFAVAVSGCGYIAAVLSPPLLDPTERIISIYSRFEPEWLHTARDAVQDVVDYRLPIYAYDEKCLYALIGANLVMWTLWRWRALRPVMLRWSAHSFVATHRLCPPMVLSAFSHYGVLHLAINMYLLSKCVGVTVDTLGANQFAAFYVTAALVASLASLAHRAVLRSPLSALGASGAVIATLMFALIRNPEHQINVLPYVTVSASSTAYAILAFDTIGLLFFRKSIFNHAAHLAGAAFGIYYAKYGADYFWGQLHTDIMQRYRTMREGGVGDSGSVDV